MNQPDEPLLPPQYRTYTAFSQAVIQAACNRVSEHIDGLVTQVPQNANLPDDDRAPQNGGVEVLRRLRALREFAREAQWAGHLIEQYLNGFVAIIQRLGWGVVSGCLAAAAGAFWLFRLLARGIAAAAGPAAEDAGGAALRYFHARRYFTWAVMVAAGAGCVRDAAQILGAREADFTERRDANMRVLLDHLFEEVTTALTDRYMARTFAGIRDPANAHRLLEQQFGRPELVNDTNVAAVFRAVQDAVQAQGNWGLPAA